MDYTPGLAGEVEKHATRLKDLEEFQAEHTTRSAERWKRFDDEVIGLRHAMAQLSEELQADRIGREKRIVLETEAVLHGLEKLALSMVREAVKGVTGRDILLPPPASK